MLLRSIDAVVEHLTDTDKIWKYATCDVDEFALDCMSDGEQPDDLHYYITSLTDWDRIGNALGINNTITCLCLRAEQDFHVSDPPCPHLQAFFTGLQQNRSITELFFDIKWIPGRNNLPHFHLQDARFKTALTRLEVYNSNCIVLTDIQCQYFGRCLRQMSSLEDLNIKTLCDSTGGSLSVVLFQTILDASSKVKRLKLKCNSPDHCQAVSSFLGHPTLGLVELDFRLDLSSIRERPSTRMNQLSTIVLGLIGNTTTCLQTMRLEQDDICFVDSHRLGWDGPGQDDYHYVPPQREGFDYRPCADPYGSISKVLCDSSSIENICNSNHTLTELFPNRVHEQGLIANCLKLNNNEKKDEVMRSKIARYFFNGDFEICVFSVMPLSHLPKVLATIDCKAYRLDRTDDTTPLTFEDIISFQPDYHEHLNKRLTQTAIFRLLRGIPELCNAPRGRAKRSHQG